jgi:hypothetical protein
MRRKATAKASAIGLPLRRRNAVEVPAFCIAAERGQKACAVIGKGRRADLAVVDCIVSALAGFIIRKINGGQGHGR